MNNLFRDFAAARSERNGYLLALTLSPDPPDHDLDRLNAIVQGSNTYSLKGDIKHFLKTNTSKGPKLSDEEFKGWSEVYQAYWKAIKERLAIKHGRSTYTKVYEIWKEVVSLLIRGYNNHGFEAWTIPTLYMVGKHLRLFAIKSDLERAKSTYEDITTANPVVMDDFEPEMDRQGQLRDCEQHLKRIFTLCLNDRAPLEESRKWGIYFIINLLFKTYFKLNQASLSRTILKTLAVYKDKGDMPPLECFPKAQRVTFKYYEGVLAFLEENYIEAEKHLTEAWALCKHDAKPQLERILTYLIPCRLLTTHVLPTKLLLEPFPHLQKIFGPLAEAIKKGDLRLFDHALVTGENEFVRRRIYLTLERSHDVALRNLLRKVFIAGGYDDPPPGDTLCMVRRTRIPVAEFKAAIKMTSGKERLDTDEVECLLANMIYKEFMKGYIARERGIVVLSKKGAFPGTGV